MSSYFRYSTQRCEELQALLGTERFGPYLASSSGIVAEAVELYVWNAALAAAFLSPLGVVEVALRNALSARLEVAFASAWYDDPAFLRSDDTGALSRRIVAAKTYIVRAKPPRPIVPSRIVAELGIGFWAALLKPAYNRTLWPVLRPAFSKYTRRKTAMRYLEPLVAFRNRVAHHEPIYDRAPIAMYEGILLLSDMLSPNLRAWIEHHSRVRSVLADGPEPARLRF